MTHGILQHEYSRNVLLRLYRKICILFHPFYKVKTKSSAMLYLAVKRTIKSRFSSFTVSFPRTYTYSFKNPSPIISVLSFQQRVKTSKANFNTCYFTLFNIIHLGKRQVWQAWNINSGARLLRFKSQLWHWRLELRQVI